MPRSVLPFENMAEMLEQLGGIDPGRIRSWPPPGKATEKDVISILNRENRLYELVDGVLVEKTMGLKESMVAGYLVRVLGVFADEHDCGAVAGADGTLKLMRKLIRIPDVSFFTWDRLPGKMYPSEPIPDLYPDLAVEVLSAGNTAREIERKLKEYFLSGTRLAWIVDLATRTVAVHTAPDRFVTLAEHDALDGGDVLPGFTLPLKDLFAHVPRPTPRKAKSPKRKNGK